MIEPKFPIWVVVVVFVCVCVCVWGGGGGGGGGYAPSRITYLKKQPNLALCCYRSNFPLVDFDEMCNELDWKLWTAL